MWEYSPEGSNAIQTYIGSGSIFRQDDLVQHGFNTVISVDHGCRITTMIMVHAMHSIPA